MTHRRLGFPSSRLVRSTIALSALLIAGAAGAAPKVWVIDDGVKLKRDQLGSSYGDGVNNPIWGPGAPIRLLSLRNETVAFQVIVESDGSAVSDVTVTFDQLTGPGGATIQNAAGATDPTDFVGRPIERFVEHYFYVDRESGGPWGSLGWHGDGAPPGDWTGWIPDALIPVEVAPSWAPYPMQVPAGQLRAVWIDITVPKSQAPGFYTGQVVVQSGGATLATFPVELDLRDAVLPDDPHRTFTYWNPAHLNNAFGSGSAGQVRDHLFQLFRRHRLTAMPWANGTGDIDNMMQALDGSLYTPGEGYEGPGEGVGEDLLVLGVYGAFGSPDQSDLNQVEDMVDMVASRGLLDEMDVFVYVVDESCGHQWGPQWNALLDSSSNPNVQNHVRTGWTCSASPASQAVDIVMTTSESYDPQETVPGKAIWVYNGVQPYAGTFFTDADAVALRVNGWLQGIHDIPRWFFWHATFWIDWNNGGLGAFNPFTEPETFHNQWGEWANGDGVLVYPGRLNDFSSHNIGMDGIIASIRLKNWRRGLQDAGYYDLARASDPSEAAAIAAGLLPQAFTTAGGPIAWSPEPAAFFDARADLADLIEPGQAPPEEPPVEEPPVEEPPVEEPPVEEPPIEDPHVEELLVGHAAGGVVVDGSLDEFDGADSVVVEAGEAVMTARLMWDAGALYLGAEVSDPELMTPGTGMDGPLWNADGIELMLDPELTRTDSPDADDRHVIVTAIADVLDAQGAGGSEDVSLDMGITAAVADLPGGGYVVELRVPWSGIGITPAGGALLGADVAVNDVSAAGLAWGDWAGLEVFAVPSAWHTIRLAVPVEEPPVEEPPVEEPPVEEPPVEEPPVEEPPVEEPPVEEPPVEEPPTEDPDDEDEPKLSFKDWLLKWWSQEKWGHHKYIKWSVRQDESGSTEAPLIESPAQRRAEAAGCTAGGPAGGSAPWVLMVMVAVAAVLRSRRPSKR